MFDNTWTVDWLKDYLAWVKRDTRVTTGAAGTMWAHRHGFVELDETTTDHPLLKRISLSLTGRILADLPDDLTEEEFAAQANLLARYNSDV